MLPEQPEERQPGDIADAPDVARQAEVAEDRQVEPAVVGGVACRPQHGAIPAAREIELGNLGRMEVERLSDLGVTSKPPRSANVSQSVRKPLVEELVGELQVGRQVLGEAHALPVGALEPPDERDREPRTRRRFVSCPPP